MNAVVKQQQTSEELKKQIEMLKAQEKELRNQLKKNKGVTCELVVTKAGKAGMRIVGLGIPKFFYKQQLLALVADTEEAHALRASIVQWVDAQGDKLTDKE